MDRYFIIDDLTFSSDINDIYYIISDELGVYLKVSKQISEFSEKIISMIKSEEEITEEIMKDPFIKDRYNQGINFLKKYNLIYKEGNIPIKKSTLETELIGTKIREFKFEKYNRNKILMYFLIVILLINIPIFIKNIEACIYSNIIKEFFLEYDKFNMISLTSIISIILVVIISVLIHEIFHILFANLYEVSIRSVSVYLLLGFQPVIFVKYRNIVTLEKLKKISVYLGGFIANLIIINISIFLISILKHWIFGIFIVVNIFLILDNLSIINNTDFYYVFTELSNQTTFKVKVLRKLSELFNKKVTIREFMLKKENLLGNMYLFIGVSFRGTSIYLFIYFIISSLTSIKYAATITAILVIIYIALSIKKFINNIKMIAI